MTLISKCCCRSSLRCGSLTSGMYTLIFYIIFLTFGAFNLEAVSDSPFMRTTTLAWIIGSGVCVIASVLLLIGLCVDSRLLLVPWMFCISLMTLATTILSVYLVVEKNYELGLLIMLTIDVISGSINMYCFICVFSQYQEYISGRGHQGSGIHKQLPPVAYAAGSTTNDSSSATKITTDHVTNNGSTTGVQSSGAAGAPSDFSFISEDSVRMGPEESPEAEPSSESVEGESNAPIANSRDDAIVCHIEIEPLIGGGGTKKTFVTRGKNLEFEI